MSEKKIRKLTIEFSGGGTCVNFLGQAEIDEIVNGITKRQWWKFSREWQRYFIDDNSEYTIIRKSSVIRLWVEDL